MKKHTLTIIEAALLGDDTVPRQQARAVIAQLEEDPAPAWISEVQAAKLLGVSSAHLLKWRHAGTLNGHPFPFTLMRSPATSRTAWLYDRVEVLDWVRTHLTPAPAAPIADRVSSPETAEGRRGCGRHQPARIADPLSPSLDTLAARAAAGPATIAAARG